MYNNYKCKLEIESLLSKYINYFFYSNKVHIKSNIINIHFIGCGGIGMCGLSLLCRQFGFNVTGSDLKKSKNTEYLTANKISVQIKHSISNLPKTSNSVVIFSSAVKKENCELKQAIARNIPCYSRGEFLAFLSTHYKTVVSIAGSHGKTTVTSMLVHILNQTYHSNLGYIIGGWPVGQKTLGNVGNGSIFVLEVDESDLSLTLMQSHIGIILNIDDDHAWNVGGSEKIIQGFITFAKRSNTVIYAEEKVSDIIHNIDCHKKRVDFKSINRLLTDNIYGHYQLKNAQTAITIASELGIQKKYSINYLKGFLGVERRMQKVFSNNQFIIYEDYAHHPSEVGVAIRAVIEKYSNRKLAVVFQPHRFARLKFYLKRFSIELKSANKVFVVPTFSAWTDKEDITELSLVEDIGDKAIYINDSWQMIASKIYSELKSARYIILILGAGDVNCMIPDLVSEITVKSDDTTE